MSDVVIKGIEIPKKGNLLMVAIFSDGSVDFKSRDEMKTHRTTAIALSSHGRLVDVDFIKSCMEEIKKNYPNVYELIVGILDRTPTVLEASTEGR